MRRDRPAVSRRGFALALAAAAAGCATAPERPGGPFVAAGFSGDQLASERVVVLPVDAVALPEGTPGSVDADSLAAALARYAGESVARALLGRGVAGRAPAPSAMAPVLETLGSVLDRAYESILRAPLGETDGALDSAAEEDWTTISEVVGARFFLVPLALGWEAVAPLEFRAELDAALVDAGAGRVVWRARIRAENPVPPPGDATDLFASALEDATAAVAERLARRLATAGGIDPDPPIDELER